MLKTVLEVNLLSCCKPIRVVLFVVPVVNAGVKLKLRCESGADVDAENRAWRKSVVVLLTYPGCAVCCACCKCWSKTEAAL